MKLYFRLTFIIIYIFTFKPSDLLARELILITYKKNKNYAVLVKQVLIKKYNLPKKYIHLKTRRKPCHIEDNEMLMLICLNKNKLNFPIIKLHKINNIIAMFQNLKLGSQNE